MKRTKWMTVTSIAAGLLIAGCGGDDDDRLSKAEFLEQGNAICKKGSDEIDAAGSKAFAGEPSKRELTAFAGRTLVPNVQRQIDGLRDLSPPENDEAKVKSILDSAQTDLDKLEADPQLVATEDPFKETNQNAKEYGLTACAE